MEKRLGVVGIILESRQSAQTVNEILHAYADLIVGRMGLPYPTREVSVISLIVDGDADRVSALTGRLGQVFGVTVKSALAKGV